MFVRLCYQLMKIEGNQQLFTEKVKMALLPAQSPLYTLMESIYVIVLHVSQGTIPFFIDELNLSKTV